MKNSFLFLCLTVLSFHQGFSMPTPGSAIRVRNVCQIKTGVSDEDIIKSQKGIFNESNEKQACFLKCILTHLSLMDKNGKLTPRQAYMMLPPKLVSELEPGIMKCSKIESQNQCIKAMKVHECIRKMYPKVYSLP